MTAYLGDVAALARKDLRLEVRARDTLPAMALFVVATLVVFHFALPATASGDAAYGLLWVAIVFTALLGLGRAWAPERRGGCARRARACAVRSQRDLAREGARDARVPRRRGSRCAAGVRPLLRTARRARRVAGVALASVGICAVGSLVSAMAAAARGREVMLPLLFLPLAIPLVVGGVGSSVSPHPGTYLAFLGLYDAVFAILSWAAFEYVVTE